MTILHMLLYQRKKRDDANFRLPSELHYKQLLRAQSRLAGLLVLSER